MTLPKLLLRSQVSAATSNRYYSAWEWLETQSQFSDSERKEMLARRYATNILSTSAAFVPNAFSIPASVTWSDGETWVDDYLGYHHTIVRSGSKIKNCERWITNPNGVIMLTGGSGSTSRYLYFFRHGQKYTVLDQGGSNPNRISIQVNGSNSTEASRRASNAFWLSSTIVAWPDGNSSIATIDILTGTTGSLSIPFTGSDFINVNQSDGSGGRFAFSNPFVDPVIASYNTANPNTAVDGDKAYRIFHVSSDKKRYIILVYTISTGAWTYLTGGAVTSESSSLVVQTIGVDAATDIDYLSLNPSGKRVVSNTSGQGFNYHYPDGTLALQVYRNSNHKSFGPIFDDKDFFTEKLSGGSNPDNPILGGKNGDMFFLTVDPTAETRDGLSAIVMPTGGDATKQGGDQGSHTGALVAAFAGHRDQEPTARETWSRQVGVLNPEPTLSQHRRFRVAALNVETGGGDDDDPGAFIGVMIEVSTGLWECEMYWHDTDVDHDGNLREGVFRTVFQIVPDTDDYSTLGTALTESDLSNTQ